MPYSKLIMNHEAVYPSFRRIDYQERPSISDFAYYTTSITGQVSESVLKATSEVKDRYGIDVKQIPWGVVPRFDGRVPYVLVDTGSYVLPTLPTDDKEYVRKLGQLPDARVNLIAIFGESNLPDRSDYEAPPQADIPVYDREYGVNTVFAEDFINGFRANSMQDIADNIVCETIRSKVRSVRDSQDDDLEKLAEQQHLYEYDIDEFRRIYKDYGLFHRSETDGALAFKTKSGYLATQTRTDKTTMTPDNFSLINRWYAQENIVAFTGEKIPTSDIEIVVALDRLGKYELAIHFHHNKITRGRRFEDHKTRMPIEYGRFESADEIAREMERIGDNWLILKEHGVLWFGNTVEEFEEFITQM